MRVARDVLIQRRTRNSEFVAGSNERLSKGISSLKEHHAVTSDVA